MKKKYFILFVLFSLSFYGFAQVNAYLFDNPVWQVKKITYPFSDAERYEDVFNYYTNGDTLIGSFIYKKTCKKGTIQHFSATGMLMETAVYDDTIPFFYLRSAATKLFLLDPANGWPDTLLYDFNLSVGDTLPHTPPVGAQTITVTSIDSIATAGGYRKRFHLLNGSTALYLYEGAGSSAGLTEPINGFFLSGSDELICYSLNDSSYFPSAGSGCNLALGIQMIVQKMDVSVFPNPFSTTITIEIAGQEIKNGKLMIYNINGKLLKEQAFSGNRILVERQKLAAGFYYYRLQADKKCTSGKLIIID